MSKIICIVCGDPKDPDEFYDSPSAKSGKSGKCKLCALDYAKGYSGDKLIPGKPNYHKNHTTLNDKFLQEAF